MLEKRNIHLKNEDSRYITYVFQNFNSKWITDLNVKHKIVQLLEDSTWEKLDDLEFGHDFIAINNHDPCQKKWEAGLQL
jgi:hypothetical protein